MYTLQLFSVFWDLWIPFEMLEQKQKVKVIWMDTNQSNFQVVVVFFFWGGGGGMYCILSLVHSMLLLTSEHDLQSFLCPAQTSHQHNFSALTWKVIQGLKLHKRAFRALGCELVMRFKMIFFEHFMFEFVWIFCWGRLICKAALHKDTPCS